MIFRPEVKYSNYSYTAALLLRLKSVFISKRKEFDKAVRKAKRKFKKTNDDDLIEFQTKDQREFWTKMGLLGLRMKGNHSYLCR